MPLVGLDVREVPKRAEETTVIASDGLPARRINLHTRDKFDRHKKYCGIFNGGVRNRWQDNRGYLELFAGGGVAVEGTDDSTPAR